MDLLDIFGGDEPLDIDGDAIVKSRGLDSPQLWELLKHIRWMESHAKLRIEQTRDSKELCAFNQGRADAVESLLAFAEKELGIEPTSPYWGKDGGHG